MSYWIHRILTAFVNWHSPLQSLIFRVPVLEEHYIIGIIAAIFHCRQCRSVYTMVFSLVEIQELAYQCEEERCERNLLHFHLTALKFAANYHSLFKNICSEKKRKIFGAPFHSVVNHMPVMYGFISLLTVAAESEERMFNAIR